MNIEVNFDNLTKKEQERFNALIEKANKPKSKVWKPNEGECYCCITAGADILDFKNNSYIDKANYDMGNCFKTRAEAEFALERIKLIAEMKRYIAEHDDIELDWNERQQEKWSILYFHDTNIIAIQSNICIQNGDKSLYASRREILKNMIKDVGEDRIKRYYFGVE